MTDSAQPVALINIVGLTSAMLDERMPRLRAHAATGTLRNLAPVLPAVTCSVQSSMLTGVPPAEHGIVGNGWYDRREGEVRFWKQSSQLVQAEKIWETARRRQPGFTCANCFWWYAMNASTDVCVTPRPMYPADGRKLPDIYTTPSTLRDELQSELGQFPLFHFWGPGADLRSSRWIAESAGIVDRQFTPDLLLVYLPHLDYDLQRFGPDDPRSHQAMREIDDVAGDLIDSLALQGRSSIIVSEYGISPVKDGVAPNRLLRSSGLLAVREEQGRELLDPLQSKAFIVADHQIGHVYVRESENIEQVARLLSGLEGVGEVLKGDAIAEAGLEHERSGDLVILSDPDRWFTWDYWLDPNQAPDFARTIDIHRKPGYDPRELFLAGGWAGSKLRIALKLLKKRLGQRTLMDVISLDTGQVGGSHGRIDPESDGILILPDSRPGFAERPCCTDVHDLVLRQLFGD